MMTITAPTTTKIHCSFFGVSSEDLQNVLDQNLPEKAFRKVVIKQSCFGSLYFQIVIAASDFCINGVSGQFPQRVSLTLDEDGFSFLHGIYGGQSIYRKPNPEHPKEKFYAMMPVKIAFRKPKNKKETILNSLAQVCERWVELLKTTEDVLYPEHVTQLFS